MTEKYKRKQIIVDKKYQFGTTNRIVGSVLVIMTIIIGTISASIVYNNTIIKKNNIQTDENNKKITNIHKIEDNVVGFLTTTHSGLDEKSYDLAMREIARKHETNLEMLRKIIEDNQQIVNFNQKIMSRNQILLIILVLLTAITSSILYKVLLKRTLRISGPAFVLKRHMKEIINGNFPIIRPLRDDDELQELYDTFVEMVDELKKREK